MGHLDCWDIEPDQFPATAPKAKQIEFLLRYAILAPSNHNTQPWIFEIDEDRVVLFADRSRSLPASDPADRELVLSCGAALFFLETAAHAFGFDVSVKRLPRADDPDRLAEIELGGPHGGRSGRQDLLEAIPRRRTNRSKFSQKALDTAVAEAIAVAASANGVSARWINAADERAELARLISLADHQQFADRAFRQELAKWVNPSRYGSPDGIPAKSIGFDAPSNYVAPLLIRTFDLGDEKAKLDESILRSSAALLIISTGFDRPLDWVTAGEALGAALLTAESLGVNASYLNQPCEIDELRRRLAELGSVQGYPQLVLRFGYGLPVPPTPRRPLASVLRVRLNTQ